MLNDEELQDLRILKLESKVVKLETQLERLLIIMDAIFEKMMK